MRKRMRKAEVLSSWREEILPQIVKRENQGNGKPDYIARWESWIIYVDSLVKDGYLSEKQINRWSLPRECGK